MGRKGDRLTKKAADASQRLVEILAGSGGVTRKKMFGGYGIFHDGAMFAIVSSDGGIYFKAGPKNRADFEKTGAEQHGKMPYFKISDSIAAEDQLLCQWAKPAIEAAHAVRSKTS